MVERVAAPAPSDAAPVEGTGRSPCRILWFAALASLGDPVDFDAAVTDYYDTTAI